MATDINERESLSNVLKKKRICRFCLTQAKLSHIFARDSQTLAPLPVQVMACASIEVFTNDGMPAWICSDCRILFEHSYRFKQMCKRADTLLRQFPLTGEWPHPLEKPKFPHIEPKQTQSPPSTSSTAATMGNILPSIQNIYTAASSQSKKILNSNPAAVPEPPIPIRTTPKKEQLIEDLDIFEVGCNELSMEDVQRLIEKVDDDEEFQTFRKPPKVLNKGSIRILNKEANVIVEPKLSTPKVKLDQDGNVFVTAVIDSLEHLEQQPLPIQSAEPVVTDVYPCPQCDRSFPLLQLRDIHMVNHNRERRFQCPDCDKSFFSKYDLQKHEVRHSGEKPYKCVVCEKGFSRATLLHRHERVHTEIPKYLCVHCEKAFLSKEEMEQHTARHEKNRPFKCRVCQKTFAFKQGLERHEAVHSSVQPYPCQYCEQSFPTPSKLARHLTAHAGKRPYPCKYCTKSYVLSHHLSRHMRSHKQSKGSHICTECNKIFKTRDELIYHTAVHSTVSLICTLCQTKLESAEAVTEHIKQHIDGDAFACEFCDLIFIKANALIYHSKEKHAKEMAVYNVEEKNIENIMTTTTTTTTTQPNADTSQTESVIDEVEDGKCDLNINDEESNHEEKSEYDKTEENIPLEVKPKILDQIVLCSEQGVKFYMVRKDGIDVSLNKSTEKNEEQEITKKRRIISVDGCLKEIDCTLADIAPPQKRNKIVSAENKVKNKETNSSPPSLERKQKNTTLQQTVTSNRRSNETKPTVNIKTEESPKRAIRKAVLSKPTASATSISPTNTKKEIQPRVNQIRMTKSQAEALTKQGRIEIKGGNMVLTKPSPQHNTRMSKREKK